MDLLQEGAPVGGFLFSFVPSGFLDARDRDGVDRRLAQTAGARLGGVGGWRAAAPAVGSREVAPGRCVGVEYEVGDLAGPPLGAEEGPQLLGGAAGVEASKPDGD